MTFIIKNENTRQQCIEAIRNMPLHPVQQVDIYDLPKNRTDRQNKAMWSWSGLIGGHEGVEKEDVKIQAVLDAGFYDVKLFNIKVGDEYKEVLVTVPRETKGMKVEELAKILDQLIIRAHFHNIKLPYTEYI